MTQNSPRFLQLLPSIDAHDTACSPESPSSATSLRAKLGFAEQLVVVPLTLSQNSRCWCAIPLEASACDDVDCCLVVEAIGGGRVVYSQP